MSVDSDIHSDICPDIELSEWFDKDVPCGYRIEGQIHCPHAAVWTYIKPCCGNRTFDCENHLAMVAGKFFKHGQLCNCSGRYHRMRRL